jgi:hypothetical protein
MRRAWVVGLFCFVMGAMGFAQVDTGVITGSVRDSQGAGVASASITIVEIDTNVTTKTQSDGTGDYASPPLRPGNYRVVVGPRDSRRRRAARSRSRCRTACEWIST